MKMQLELWVEADIVPWLRVMAYQYVSDRTAQYVGIKHIWLRQGMKH
jgi:hypothetical protein